MTKNQKKKLKSRLPSILLFCVFLSGLSLLLYPTVADWWNSFHATRAITVYQDSIAAVSDDEYEEMLEEAQAFNEELLNSPSRFSLSEDETAEYDSIMDVTGTGIMGWISIPVMGVKLPIYHGTDAAVLQVGAGHLAGTSFPIGGLGTHAVISAHSGLPSAKLFTGLDIMEPGDLIYINVLGEQHTYSVTRVLTVLPEEMDALSIDPEKDQITLVTCTPYGVNTHRLLVTAERTDSTTLVDVRADARQISSNYTAIAIAVTLVIIATAYITVKSGIQKHKRKHSL